MIAITCCSYIGSQFRNALVKQNENEILRHVDDSLYKTQMYYLLSDLGPNVSVLLFTDTEGRLSCLATGLGREQRTEEEIEEGKIMNIIFVEESPDERSDIVAMFNGFIKDFYEYQRVFLKSMICNNNKSVESYSFDINALFNCIDKSNIPPRLCKMSGNLQKNSVIAFYTPHKEQSCNISYVLKSLKGTNYKASKSDIYFSSMSEKKLTTKLLLFTLKSKVTCIFNK